MVGKKKEYPEFQASLWYVQSEKLNPKQDR